MSIHVVHIEVAPIVRRLAEERFVVSGVLVAARIESLTVGDELAAVGSGGFQVS